MTSGPLALFAMSLAVACVWRPVYAAQEFELRVVSSPADAVSGGAVLVQFDSPSRSNWTVHLDNRDITASFHLSKRSGKLLALLKGLKIGKSTLETRVNGRTKSEIQIFNHPLAGPMFSDQHQQPFICQTEANGLGPALDEDCSAKTLVQYYYKSTEPPLKSDRDRFIASYDSIFSPTPTTLAPGFKPYDPSGPLPRDVAQTVTSDGQTVDYIVRKEIGVINRAVYEIQFIHASGHPLPTPWTSPTPGWNGKVVYTFGPGCGPGYHQGVLPEFGSTTDFNYEPILAQGYALVTSSLNVLANNCNDKISAETASMVKEHFIKQYGEPMYTIGLGGSGGAVSVYLIAQNYPGILDGIIAYLSAPDIVTTVIPVFSDCALLHQALNQSIHSWTEMQKTAISGFATWESCPKEAAWLDPKGCDSSLPKGRVYDRISNPKGTRCTFYDNAINIFGSDSKTGFARRTLDNVGIQYGLVAFLTGKIDAEQFIELNERIGGYDEDGEIVSTRTIADPTALRQAYERGVAVTGRSLANVPIIDWTRYVDDLPGNFHTRDRAFITRSRLITANGNAGNQTILVTPRPSYEDLTVLNIRPMPGVGLQTLVTQMDLWLASIAADHQSTRLAAKIINNKPVNLADGCIAVNGERIVEPATYNGAGRCNQMYPSHGNPRVAAGAPIAGDIMKCALRPVDPSDYSNRLKADQLKRLTAVFPTGVCDYNMQGIGQQTEPTIWH
jgi:hypothetical protein